MRRHVLVGAFVSVLFLVLIAAPAAAKFPPFTGTIHVEGSAATVTIVLEGYDPEVPALEGLLGLFPAEALHSDQRSSETAMERIDMVWIDAFTYEGSVVVPYPGEWVVSRALRADDELPAELYPPMAFEVPGGVEGDDAKVGDGLVDSDSTNELLAGRQGSETVSKTIDATDIDRDARQSSVTADAGEDLAFGPPKTVWAAVVVSGVILGAWWFRRGPQDKQVPRN